MLLSHTANAKSCSRLGFTMQWLRRYRGDSCVSRPSPATRYDVADRSVNVNYEVVCSIALGLVAITKTANAAIVAAGSASSP